MSHGDGFQKMLKLAFIIDKKQTYQIIAGLLDHAIHRGHECTLFCVFESEELLTKYKNLMFVRSPDKNRVIQKATELSANFDAILGINLFNAGWTSLYSNTVTPTYAFEYCWNEIYNVQRKSSSLTNDTILFCNTDTSHEIIENFSPCTKIKSEGSPWFEYLMGFKTNKRKKITFLVPHQSLYSVDRSIKPMTETLLRILRNFATREGCRLVLKDRAKYSERYDKIIDFDQVVSDDSLDTHIKLYSESSIVLHFCSSAINELAYVETPSLSLCPDLQERLHAGSVLTPSIGLLHKKYYDGKIFDGKHNDSLRSSDINDERLVLEKLTSLLSNTTTNRSWSNYQNSFFPGEHLGSASRILNFIEKQNE